MRRSGMRLGMDKLSIVIPAYNAEKNLGRCLDHILQQTYGNFEVIVVNDASEDHTQDILEAYAGRDGRIIGMKNEVNRGPAAGRQKGMETATGTYLTFMDADDWYGRKDALELIMRKMEKNGVDCLMFGYLARHRNGIWIPHGLPFRLRGRYDARTLMEKKERLQAPAFHYVWNKVYRLELLKKEKIRFDETLRRAEDVKFNNDFLWKADTFFLLNQLLYVYDCRNTGSISRAPRETSGTWKEAICDIERLENDYRESRDRYRLCGASEKTISFLMENTLRLYLWMLDQYRGLISEEELGQREVYQELLTGLSRFRRSVVTEEYRLEKRKRKFRKAVKHVLLAKRFWVRDGRNGR